MDAEKSSMYFNLFVIPSKVRKNNQTDVPVCCVCVNRFANCTYVSRCLTWSCRVHPGNSYWMVYIYSPGHTYGQNHRQWRIGVHPRGEVQGGFPILGAALFLFQ